MGPWLLVAVLCVGPQVTARHTYVGHKRLRISVPDSGRWMELRDLLFSVSPGMDVWSEPGLDPWADVHVDADEWPRVRDILEDANFQYNITTTDIQRLLDASHAVPTPAPKPDSRRRPSRHKRYRRAVSSTLSNKIIGTYARFGEIEHYLWEVAAFVPEIATLTEIGRTFENRPILLLKLGIPRQTAKPALWVDGGVHAREWISPATVMFIIYKLLAGYLDGESRTVAMLTNLDWYLLPVANPDGYEYSHVEERLWRKNRSPNPGSECIGTDLNRNFDFHWGGGRTSTVPCSLTYGGHNASSELETQAVTQALLALRGRLFAYITIHSYAQTWFIRWSYTKEFADFHNDTLNVANMAVKEIQAEGGAVFRTGRSFELLYAYAGGSPDWAHGVAGIHYSFAIELRDRGSWGFLLPEAYIDVSGREIFAGLSVVADRLCNMTCNLTNLTDNFRFSIYNTGHRPRGVAVVVLISIVTWTATALLAPLWDT